MAGNVRHRCILGLCLARKNPHWHGRCLFIITDFLTRRVLLRPAAALATWRVEELPTLASP